jgi:hypothetical protein
MSASARLSREEIEREVNSVPFWWHSIEIGAVTTPGKSEPELQRRIVRTFPDLRGKFVPLNILTKFRGTSQLDPVRYRALVKAHK